MRTTFPHSVVIYLKRIAVTAVLVALCGLAALHAQDISQIGKSDPLIISGSIGTNNTYYHSSAGAGYASPLSNSVFANINVNIYGFSFPFAVCYSNNNMSFSYPQFSFNIAPKYKYFTAHFGRSTIPFSNYIMNMSFNGVGLEYNGPKFRTAAFYGILRKAINDNPEDPNPRTAQYERVGWGFSTGYGNGGHSIDIYLLRAYDRPSTIDEAWRESVRPQENLLVGIKARTSFKKFLSLNVNAATSAFTADRESPKVEVGEATRFDKIFEARYTSRIRFAGDASLGFSLPFLNGSVFYKIIQPDYVSLGTYYTSNNYQSLGATLSTRLFRRISLSGNFSMQNDNLSKEQLYTNNGYVYSAIASYSHSSGFSISGMFNGYLQRQDDGAAAVNDTTRVNRELRSFSLNSSYSRPGDTFDHSVSLSANYTENIDHNRFNIGLSDCKTMALGASYTLGVNPWEVDFGLSTSYQETKGFNTKYSSAVGSFSTGRGFLKDKNLNVSATVSICYNHVKFTSKSLSMALDLSASYTIKQSHSFSASASFSKYGDVNPTQTQSGLNSTDIRLSLNYVYTFSLFHLKKKQSEKPKNSQLAYQTQNKSKYNSPQVGPVR